MPRQSTQVMRICEHCGETFAVKPSRLKRSSEPRFCSIACYRATTPKTLIDLTCAHCGKTFTVTPERVRRGVVQWCSRGCRHADRARPKVEAHCLHCGKQFMIAPYLVERGEGRYCSNACTTAAQRFVIARVCPQCGKTFETKPSHLTTGRGKYCSLECKHVGRRVAPDQLSTKRADRWRAMSHIVYREWRTAVYQRDGYTCQRCGKKGGALNAHHIKPWKAHPDLRYDVANGITLCADCHRAMHRIAERTV